MKNICPCTKQQLLTCQETQKRKRHSARGGFEHPIDATEKHHFLDTSVPWMPPLCQLFCGVGKRMRAVKACQYESMLNYPDIIPSPSLEVAEHIRGYELALAVQRKPQRRMRRKGKCERGEEKRDGTSAGPPNAPLRFSVTSVLGDCGHEQ